MSFPLLIAPLAASQGCPVPLLAVVGLPDGSAQVSSCATEGYAGRAARYKPAPFDASVALNTGECLEVARRKQFLPTPSRFAYWAAVVDPVPPDGVVSESHQPPRPPDPDSRGGNARSRTQAAATSCPGCRPHPTIDTTLHQQRRAGVPQYVRRHLGAEPTLPRQSPCVRSRPPSRPTGLRVARATTHPDRCHRAL
jgi:hypothetical protein